MRISRILSAAAVCAVTSQAQAVPLLLDFTDGSWSAVDGTTTYSRSYGAFEVTLRSVGGAMTFNAHEAPSSAIGADFLALDGDGIGIGDDEIGSGERLEVRFNQAVTVTSYYLLDLFPGEGPDGAGESAHLLFDLPNGVGATDIGTATSATGFFAREALGLDGVSWLSASTLGFDEYEFNDFALGGLRLDGVDVPEPGTFGLLGAGLLGFGLAHLRRRALGTRAQRGFPR